MSFRLLWLSILLVVSLTLSANVKADCTVTSGSTTNLTVSRNSGNTPVTNFVSLMLYCQGRDAYTVSADTGPQFALIGSGPNKIRAILNKDTAQTQLLGSPITGAKNNSAGTVEVRIYVRTSGETNSTIIGSGNYSVQLTGTVTSGATVTPYTVTVSGTITATCTIDNASINFGTVQSGTNPIQSVGIGMSCSEGVYYTITQQGGSPIYVDSNIKGYSWVFSDSTQSQALADTPLQRIGSTGGAASVVTMYVRLDGISRGSPLLGAGVFTSTIPLVLTY